MGEHNWGQGPGSGQGYSPAFNRSAYGIPLDSIWGLSRSGAPSISSLLPQQAVEAPPEEEWNADPARADFWARPGAGYRLLAVMAAIHMGMGLLGAAAGALVWYLTQFMVLLPALAAVIGAIVALAGAIAFELARTWGPRAALVARVLLPAVDLAAAAVLLWLLGDSALTVLLFVLPALTASVLLSWRSGTVFASFSLAGFAALNALRPGTPLNQWAAETLVLAGVTSVIVLGVGIYAVILAGVQETLHTEVVLLRRQRATQATEQQRLLETLNLLEDAQARLERERVQVNQQIAEIANATHRLADGDPSAIRALQPGLFGPLEAVRAALGRVSLRLGIGSGPLPSPQEQQRALETVLAASREQAQLLAGTDAALRALGISANELVAEVQRVERGSGELPGIDRHQLFQAMRAMEQRAMGQASNTAMLVARLAQLRMRQSEVEAELRRLSRLIQSPGNQPEWGRSGLYARQAGTQPGTGESQFFGNGENSGAWR